MPVDGPAREEPTSGMRVHTLGNPGASEGLWVYTQGYVKQTTEKIAKSPGRVIALVVEVSNMINPGDSGGPLINDRAEVVGVCSYSHHSEGSQPVLNFIHVREVFAVMKNVP